MRRIVVTAPFLLRRNESWNEGYELIPAERVGELPLSDRAAIEVIVTNGDMWDSTLLNLLPNVRLVACFSTGYSSIDLAQLRARGIALTTAAGVNAHDVADHAIALLLAWWHQIPQLDEAVRGGVWHPKLTPRHSLRGKRAGIVGLGRVGLLIAERAEALGLEVSWWGPRIKPAARFSRASSLHALAENSDILIVAMRSSALNAGLIDHGILMALGKDGVLINVSRGMVLDEAALLRVLQAGDIAGAALDVFTQEPPDPQKWRSLRNVVLTPHVAGFTQEAGQSMFGQLRENLRRHYSGAALLTPVGDLE